MATTDPTECASTTAATEGDPGAALVDAYGAMSRALAERLGVDAETHWELLAAAERAGLDEEALDDLRRVTRIYERTAFAPESVPAADQRWARRVASRLGDLVG